MTTPSPVEAMTAARDACRQVSDDIINEVRDYRDSYAPLHDDSRAQLADEIDNARYWRRMSAHFGRLIPAVDE